MNVASVILSLRQAPNSTALAIDGGRPIRDVSRAWPRWPIPSHNVEANLLDVVKSGRWALSSPAVGGSQLWERRLASEFADYIGTRYCVPVDHGSSALVIAMEALCLPFGSRVLVPALTWTASATAALRAGLVPVLTDVDLATGCIGPDHLDFGVSARAVLAVHFASAMADVPALIAATEAHDMRVLEDAAQAHGAAWRGARAGSIGELGCFSFQHGKVLTGGEGGAVVTNNESLASTLEELRADSRRYRSDATPPGELDLRESASVQGANYCMSEFNAAVVSAQLEELEQQHALRQRNFALLLDLLSETDEVSVLKPAAAQTQMSMYEATFIFKNPSAERPISEIARALTLELGRRFYPVDVPLQRSPLLQPWTKTSLEALSDDFSYINRGRDYPNAEYFARHAVQTHHSAFLGDERDIGDIATAMTKVALSK